MLDSTQNILQSYQKWFWIPLKIFYSNIANIFSRDFLFCFVCRSSIWVMCALTWGLKWNVCRVAALECPCCCSFSASVAGFVFFTLCTKSTSHDGDRMSFTVSVTLPNSDWNEETWLVVNFSTKQLTGKAWVWGKPSTRTRGHKSGSIHSQHLLHTHKTFCKQWLQSHWAANSREMTQQVKFCVCVCVVKPRFVTTKWGIWWVGPKTPDRVREGVQP